MLPLAALAVHQLRYWLAYGPSAGHELLEQGHSYLHSLTPWLVLAAAVGAGRVLGRVARTGERSRTLRVWLVAAAALLAIYTGQELLEGLLSTGHPGGLGGVFGGGGFWAVPAALWVGGLVALALRGAELVLARLVARAVPAPRRSCRPPARPSVVSLSPVAPLATAAAGRAPPVA